MMAALHHLHEVLSTGQATFKKNFRDKSDAERSQNVSSTTNLSRTSWMNWVSSRIACQVLLDSSNGGDAGSVCISISTKDHPTHLGINQTKASFTRRRRIEAFSRMFKSCPSFKLRFSGNLQLSLPASH